MTSSILKIVPAAILVAALLSAQQPATPTAKPHAQPAVEQPAPAAAKTAAASPAPAAEAKSWRAGVKFSGQLLNMFNQSQLDTFDSIPWKFTSANTTDISNHLGFGLTAAYDISSRVSLNVDILYRRAGYRSGLEITEGEDDEDTDEDDRKFTTGFEQTKVDYWDLPFTLRLHDGPATDRVRGFLELGGTLRHAASVRTYSETGSPGVVSVVDTTPVKVSNPNTFGGTVGAGWDWRTVRGINFVPQLRYTYWMKPAFNSPTTRSARSQIEILIGITF